MVQYLTTKNGRRKAVVIPIKEWEKMQAEGRKREILDNIRQGAIEVKAMIDAGVKGRSWEEVMRELNEED